MRRTKPTSKHRDHTSADYTSQRPPLPLTNYTLSTVCPACTTPTYKLACKVRCPKCGFMWDCSEL